MRSLSNGDDLAITWILSILSFLSSGLRIPHSIAIALAVCILSPVIILTSTPAFLHDSTAVLTPIRHGSFKPTSPIKSKPESGLQLEGDLLELPPRQWSLLQQ
ncbi:hypothetical protein NC652_030883 [Populus alba x Populus x berolinensis]|nr:hypothetical protein NC652_030883 [Populus alba x Populus x berolinensis]